MLFARRGGVRSARPLCYSLPNTHPQTRSDGRGKAGGTEEKASLLCETLRERPFNLLWILARQTIVFRAIY